MSESISKISAALVKAQRAFGPALKTATNPHFRTKYADLSSVIEAVIGGLNDAGIALIQKQHPHDGGVRVETVFVHESGEMFSCGILEVPAAKSDPQGYGSALTYARRYSIMAACGIAPEDDDGNAAAAAAKAAAVRAAEAAKASVQKMDPAKISDWLQAIKEAGADELDEFKRLALAAATDLKDAEAFAAFSSAAKKRRAELAKVAA